MDIRLVVTDLDGTLLSPERTISDRAVEVIQRLREQKILFTFITGRPWCAAERFARRVGIEIPVITCNGAVINRGYEIIWRDPMPLLHLRGLLEAAVDEGLTVLFSQKGAETAMSETDWVKQRNYPVHYPEDQEWSELTADKVNLISGERQEAFRRLSGSFQGLSGKYKFVCYGDTGCEIAGKGVTKAAALERYAAALGLDLKKQVMAVGDNENDLEMLRAAAVGAAVSNATEAAKEAADYVCAASRTNGVIEAIERFCLGVPE